MNILQYLRRITFFFANSRKVITVLCCFFVLFAIGTELIIAAIPQYYVPTNYLPTNGRYSNPDYWQLYANGIVIKDVVFRQVPLVGPPPPLGGNQWYPIDCQMDCYLSIDGGATYSFRTAPVSAMVRYDHTTSGDYTETFATEVIALDIAGGDLGVVRLRESPTLASTGTQHTAIKGGRYSVDSFFDIFTEVSVDGGGTWWPAAGSGTLTFSYPPECHFYQELFPPPPLDAMYTNNSADTIVYTSNVWIRSFNFNRYTMGMPLPPPGGNQIHAFGDEVRFDMTMDGGATWSPVTTAGNNTVRVTNAIDVPPARFFDTEMLSMDISGGGLPGGIMIRESPSKASLGKLNDERLSGYGYTFSSFFDIFTELSMDGGQNWHHASRSIPVFLVRNPEVDVFTHTMAQMTILYPNQMTETINLTGPTTVNVFIPPDGSAYDYDGNGRDEVFSEMVSMSLIGTSMGGPVKVTLAPRSHTWGEIEEHANATAGTLDIPPFTAAGTASSFFDVFFEVEVAGMKMYGATPARMQATISHKPPAQGETYQTWPDPIALVDSLGNPTGFTLISARHTPNPIIEIDVFPNTKASVQIIYPDQTSEVVQLRGPTTVDVYVGTLGEATDTDGDGLDQVSTEIVLMNLTGTSTVMGPVILRLRDVAKHPFQRTLGQIEENANATVGILDLPPFTSSGTASSFFDVFFEIEAGGMILHNGAPKHMHTTITHKPPAQGETYEDPFIVALVDENNLPTGVNISQASHTPNPFGSISGYKWKDSDHNGIWDRGEPSVSGWTIRISGAASGSTVTNDTGWYEFTNLPSGSYEIQEDVQEQWGQMYPIFSHLIYLGDGQEVRGLREQTVVPNFGNYRIPYDCPPWTHRFDKKKEGMGFKIPTDAKLMTRNLAIRDNGDIYICGYSDGYGTKYDYITNKYDVNGRLLWSKRYNNGPLKKDDKAYALTIDDSGNVYVTGESDGGSTKMDIFTIKYNVNGDSIWSARYTSTEAGKDAGYAIALNDEGSIVYVTGETYGGKAAKSNLITLAYNAFTGAQLGVVQIYNGPGSKVDKGYAIDVDVSGSPVVTGESDGGATKPDYVTIKYNLGLIGVPIWINRYDGPPSKKDYAFAIKTDAQGSVYVTGASEGEGTSYDYATVKYSAAGAQRWVARYDEIKKKDFGYDLALDANSDVYVTGASTNKDTKLDYATLKYDGLTGAPLWATENRYDGIRKNDIARSVVVCDAEKAVFVTGSCDLGAGRKLDYVTLKIDAATGLMSWIKGGIYNGPGHKNDIAYNVAVRPEDCCVVLTGTSDGGKITKMDFATIQGPSGAAVPGSITTPAVYDGEDYEDGEELPTVYSLKQNYPNPFNPTTIIEFELPEEAFVSLRVYNILGQELVKVLDNELMDSGLQEAEFDASSLASGVYFYRIAARGIDEDGIQTSTFNSVKKMLLLR